MKKRQNISEECIFWIVAGHLLWCNNFMRQGKPKSFTLLELLIVVAIIGILAAIAVPNFLESQVRAKVSRVKADMRALKLAIECYRTDHSALPEGDYFPEDFVRYRLSRLTTPVAYISSLPGDPFYTTTYSRTPAGDEPSFIYHIARHHRYWFLGPYNWNPSHPHWVFWPRNMYPEWILVSKGPWGIMEPFVYAIPYDPTNGTVSFGEIVTWGP